jgi:hypothetical protein
LKRYKPGDVVTIIYNPGIPSVASIYAFIGYWIRWQELVFTASFFIILFFAAKSITGHTETDSIPPVDVRKKRKYDD